MTNQTSPRTPSLYLKGLIAVVTDTDLVLISCGRYALLKNSAGGA